MRIYYHQYSIDEPVANVLALMFFTAQYYGYVIDASGNVTQKYPNQSLKSLRIFNAYKRANQPVTSQITNYGFSAKAWNYADFYQWGNDNNGTPRDQCKYSFFGYIRGDDSGNIWLINNGTQTQFPSTIPSAAELPAVRYILPYPNLAIQRSAGAYQNYYGY